MDDLKNKYEESQKNLQMLKRLSTAAVADYEELQSKFVKNQQQHEEMCKKLAETEDELQQLKNVLGPACNEYNRITDQLEVERACRSEAEKFATKQHVEYKKLKRQSQMLIDRLNGINQPLPDLLPDLADLPDDSTDGTTDDAAANTHIALTSKINMLETEKRELEVKLLQADKERRIATQNEKDLGKKNQKLQNELLQVCKRLHEHEQAVANFKKTSILALDEYTELKDKYEEQLTLNQAAEEFAHQMYTDREAMKRQSTVLLATAASDTRLMEALMEIENLTKELETIKQENKEKVEELEKVLSVEDNTKKIADLETELEIAGSEVLRLQKALEDMEEWKETLVKENKELSTKLDEALRPPPPPAPPPPPPFLGPQKLVIVKKTSTANTGTPTSAPVSIEQSKAALVNEMMERIKSGKPRPSSTKTSPRPAAAPANHMNELQRLLTKRNISTAPSIDDVKAAGSGGNSMVFPAAPATAPVTTARPSLLKPTPPTPQPIERSTSTKVPPPIKPKTGTLRGGMKFAKIEELAHANGETATNDDSANKHKETTDQSAAAVKSEADETGSSTDL